MHLGPGSAEFSLYPKILSGQQSQPETADLMLRSFNPNKALRSFK